MKVIHKVANYNLRQSNTYKRRTHKKEAPASTKAASVSKGFEMFLYEMNIRIPMVTLKSLRTQIWWFSKEFVIILPPYSVMLLAFSYRFTNL